ncbi:MAG: ATP-binding protein [Pseudomonadota bacterium]
MRETGAISPELAAALEARGASVLEMCREALPSESVVFVEVDETVNRLTVLQAVGVTEALDDHARAKLAELVCALGGGEAAAAQSTLEIEPTPADAMPAGQARTRRLPCLAAAVTLPGAKHPSALCFLQNDAREFDAREARLARRLADQLTQSLADFAELFALREEAVLFRLSEAAARIGHWTLDLAHQTLHWSDEIYRIHGVTPAQYVPELTSAIGFYHPQDIPLVTAKLDGVVSTGQPDEFRLRILTPSGELRHVHATLRAQADVQPPVDVVFGTFSDISEQVAASRELELQSEQLQRVFNTVPVRLWIKDAHNRILSLNPAAAAFSGITLDQHDSGVAVSELFPDSAASHHAADLAALRDGPRLGRIEHYRKADGTSGWVRTDRVPYADPQSGEPRILLSSIDVTLEKRYEDELQARTEELRRVNQELEDFVYAASHDLRSPLRAIAHLSAWLEEDLGSGLQEESREHLTLMRARVRRLDQLLSDLLAYSRAGRTRARLGEVDLREIVHNTFDLLGLQGRFTLETSGLDLRLRTAVAPLEQALRNLIDNAAKHHDREQGLIRVSASRRVGLIEFAVADDGPGIAQEHHQRVFRAFQTLQSRDEVESSGMGLAILKKLVEYAGGTISLDSNPASGSRGATFRFTWPLHWPYSGGHPQAE